VSSSEKIVETIFSRPRHIAAGKRRDFCRLGISHWAGGATHRPVFFSDQRVARRAHPHRPASADARSIGECGGIFDALEKRAEPERARLAGRSFDEDIR
jgi:hypothetical protein